MAMPTSLIRMGNRLTVGTLRSVARSRNTLEAITSSTDRHIDGLRGAVAWASPRGPRPLNTVTTLSRESPTLRTQRTEMVAVTALRYGRCMSAHTAVTAARWRAVRSSVSKVLAVASLRSWRNAMTSPCTTSGQHRPEALALAALNLVQAEVYGHVGWFQEYWILRQLDG